MEKLKMKQPESSAKEDKEKLKALREERKTLLDRNKERLKKQNQEVNLVKKALKDAPLTVPELAAVTGLASDQVLWYVSALKKYGEIAEGELTANYFKYVLLSKSTAKDESEE
jgi:hypothetical protein